jgi:hypothetical protein
MTFQQFVFHLQATDVEDWLMEASFCWICTKPTLFGTVGTETCLSLRRRAHRSLEMSTLQGSCLVMDVVDDGDITIDELT